MECRADHDGKLHGALLPVSMKRHAPISVRQSGPKQTAGLLPRHDHPLACRGRLVGIEPPPCLAEIAHLVDREISDDAPFFFGYRWTRPRRLHYNTSPTKGEVSQMPWTGRAVESWHFFEPDGGWGPSLEDGADDYVTVRNERCRYDAVTDQDGQHLVLRVWDWEIVSECQTFEEACQHARYLATW